MSNPDPSQLFMLALFREETQRDRERLIENGIKLSRHFHTRLSLCCSEKDVISLERILSRMWKRHNRMPLIQVCSVMGNFVEGILKQVDEYRVDLLIMQSSKTTLVSHPKKRLIAASPIPILILTRNIELTQAKMRSLFFLEWNETVDRETFSILEEMMEKSGHPVLLAREGQLAPMTITRRTLKVA